MFSSSEKYSLEKISNIKNSDFETFINTNIYNNKLFVKFIDRFNEYLSILNKIIDILSNNKHLLNISIAYKINIFDLSLKIEESIHNYSKLLILNNSFNPDFIKSIYLDKIDSIIKNLELKCDMNDSLLLEKLFTNQVSSDNIAFLKPEELNPLVWNDVLTKVKYYKTKEKEISSSTIYTCKKCKTNNCRIIHMQLRASDEPVTELITCLNCSYFFTRN